MKRLSCRNSFHLSCKKIAEEASDIYLKVDVFDDEERILRIYVLEGKIMWSIFNEIENFQCPMDNQHFHFRH